MRRRILILAAMIPLALISSCMDGRHHRPGHDRPPHDRPDRR